MTYPIAEIFHSLQGEGNWTGTPMMFVRLAGCNVGKYVATVPEGHTFSAPELGPVQHAELKMLMDQRHSVCTTFDGQKFLCDTDYHTSSHMTVEEIGAELKGELHVCITGGEPLLHNLDPLIQHLEHCAEGLSIHLETSGTLEVKGDLIPDWVTCCPKSVGEPRLHYSIPAITNEVKLLVGPNFDEDHMVEMEHTFEDCLHYLQPINGVHDLWRANLDHCLALLKRHPGWALSAQLHKYLEVR